MWMIMLISTSYGVYGLVVRPGSVPFPVGIASLGEWLWVPAVGLFVVYPILLFPAVLRYRLYEIDIIIEPHPRLRIAYRDLGGVYFGAATATRAIFQTLSGQEEPPTLAIVASTLATAALFTPLRQRIQSFMDRRFYGRKYDARKTLETFSAKLRDETDLDALNGELVGVVWETMQSAHTSLWLRPDAPPRRASTLAAVPFTLYANWALIDACVVAKCNNARYGHR
jgi:hypothetical protein